MKRRLQAKPGSVSWRLVCIVLLSITGTGANAQTNVSGIISSNTTWTKANSPYIITGNTLIDNGVKLVIEPGVTIRFSSLKMLQVNGSLIARGTIADTINFTSDLASKHAGDWGCIYFTDSSADAEFDSIGNYRNGSIVEYCNIEYAGGLPPFIPDNEISLHSGCIIVAHSSPFISHSRIHDNANRAITCLDTSSPVIKGNFIHSNQVSGYGTTGSGGGIYCNLGGTVIDSNRFYNNSAGGSSGYGGGAIYINWGNAKISNNIINNNYAAGASMGGGGIYVNRGNVEIESNVLFQNTGGYGGAAIFNYFGTINVSRNLIISNHTSGTYGGAGILLYYPGQVSARNNIFSKNGASNTSSLGGAISVYPIGQNYAYSIDLEHNAFLSDSAQNYSAIQYQSTNGRNVTSNLFYGNRSISSGSKTICISGFPIFNHNNIIGNYASFDLINNNMATAQKLDARYTWWGTSNDSVIQKNIFDWNDDGTKSVVDYSSYLSSPDTSAPISPPQNISFVFEGNTIGISWNQNAEKDLAGYNIYFGNPTGYSFSHKIKAGLVNSYLFSDTSIPDVIGITAYDSMADGIDDIVEGHESWYAFVYPNGVTPVSHMTIRETGAASPKAYTYNQASRTLTVFMRSAGTMDLKLFDISGKCTQTLSNSVKSPGKYDFHLGYLPHGYYLARANIDGKPQVIPIVLSK